MDTKTWVRILKETHGEILIVVPDGRDFTARAKRESEVRFYALHQLSTKWVKEARYDLEKCPLMKISEYLDVRLETMAERN